MGAEKECPESQPHVGEQLADLWLKGLGQSAREQDTQKMWSDSLEANSSFDWSKRKKTDLNRAGQSQERS